MSIEKIVHYLLLNVLALVLCTAAAAQARFSTIVKEKRPALDEYVEVEYTVENASSVERIAPPSFKKFRVIQGPVQSNGMSYTNGIMSQFRSVSFILKPLSTGIQVVPGASAIVDGKTMRSEPVVLDVRDPGKSNGRKIVPEPLWPHEEPQIEEEFTLKPGESVAKKIKQNLLVQAEINKTSCYEGEPIIASFKLASRLRSESKVLKRPSLNGFSVFDMIEPEANNPSVEMINGKAFNVHVIRKAQLFPLQAGTFAIDPVELDNKVKFFKRTKDGPQPQTPIQQLLEEYINQGQHGNIEEHSFTLASKPLTVVVKPLPEADKPSGFNGAVGKFTMEADLKDTSVTSGEAIALSIEIRGEGNFTVINPLQVELPKGMEAYDPEIHENVDKSIYPLQGSKTFDYTLIAKDTGDYIIPGLVFSYFDPAIAKYKTETSDTFTVHVSPSKNIVALANPRPALHSDAGASGWKNWISPMGWLALGSAFVLLSLGFIVYAGKRRKLKNARPAVPPVTKPAEPVPPPEDPLENARQALSQGKSQAFYSEINKAVWKKLAEHMPIPPTRLNKFNAVNQLREKGLDSGITGQFESVLNDCEVALYTPVHTASDMQQTLEKAEQFIRSLGHQLT